MATPTLPETTRSLRGQLFTPSRLLEDRQLLKNLKLLINDAYDGQEHSASNPGFEQRIQTDDQLVQEVGPHGTIAVVFDDTAVPAENRYGGLVAVASIKPWKGTQVQAFLASLAAAGEPDMTSTPPAAPYNDLEGDNDCWDWEIGTCASANHPRYRGTGAVSRCVEILIRDLQARRDGAEDDDVIHSKQVRLWVSALVGVGNVEYWTRRGFVTVCVERAPRGTWGSKEEFEIVTMNKVVA